MTEVVGGSFRDPSGFVFRRDGVLHRQVNESFREHYDLFMASGLYESLVSDGLLVPHEESAEPPAAPGAYKILRPREIPFVSYPYEWCFSQLKDAALATLRIQQRAMEHGMSMRDASAYNIQFVDGRPLSIDTLSFERLPEGRPWVAYRQYCQHFLAPLALMAYRDVRLGQLLRVHIDGVPVDLAAALLPRKTKRTSLLLHIHAHAKSQRRYQDRELGDRQRRGVSANALRAIVAGLARATTKLTWEPDRTVWTSYYSDEESYTPEALEHKKALVSTMIEEVAPRTMWDLGANTGLYSRLGSQRGVRTVSLEMDPGCVEASWRAVREKGERNLLPLVQDLANPSPRIGWENGERASLADRGPADLALALALVHHLAIGNNVPLVRIARHLRALARSLVIECVPKGDPQVRRMLATREDVFPRYARDGFEAAFSEVFRIERTEPIAGSERILYLMR
ncbi:MAG: SAM-dependent methyltransferase [Acidobacteria bacterium]|nr:SAM-dependent methyltransferase [Acidobacteriota bacterium]